MGHLASAAPPGRVITSDGVELYCQDRGKGPPVVFLASWSLPGSSWDYQVAALLAAGFRCITYDRRGHGRSADPGVGYDFDTLADDLAAVLDARDVSAATLVTFSAGAGEAVRYLSRHGRQRIARLAMIGPTTPLLVRTDDNPGGIEPAVFATFLSDELRRDWPAWLAANARPFGGAQASQPMLDWIVSLALQASLPALDAFYQELTTADLRGELARLDLPVLVLQGDQDATCPLELTGRPTARLVPGARLLVYEDAPHGLPVSHMARLNADLTRFLRESG